jgi:hypothetical protein
MGKAIEFGLKKKEATFAALKGSVLLHKEYGPITALSLESTDAETKIRAAVIVSNAECLASLDSVRFLTKIESKLIKNKSGLDLAESLSAFLQAQAKYKTFEELELLAAFVVDDSGEEFIKVGNTSAIRVALTRGTSLFLKLNEPDAEEVQKLRFRKSQSVTLISL